MKKYKLLTLVILGLGVCVCISICTGVFGSKTYYPGDGDKYLQQELQKYRNSDKFREPVKKGIAAGYRYFMPEVSTHTVGRNGDTLTLENDMCTLTLRTKRGK